MSHPTCRACGIATAEAVSAAYLPRRRPLNNKPLLSASRPPHHHPRRPQRRHFHDYFITHLPSSSLHPDSRHSAGPRHNLPRSASQPHIPGSPDEAAPVPLGPSARDTTVVRIPLQKAKHHFGASRSRGSRDHNEDAYQAGVIELPAFAKRTPISLTRRAPPTSPLQAYRERQQQKLLEENREKGGEAGGEGGEEGVGAQNASGDPQVFYFGVFDGHGGTECSGFLMDELHKYIESAAKDFGLRSTLSGPTAPSFLPKTTTVAKNVRHPESNSTGRSTVGLERKDYHTTPQQAASAAPLLGDGDAMSPVAPQAANMDHVLQLERKLISSWKKLVGGYFDRFKPALFSHTTTNDATTMLTYAFLQADYEFVSAQARKPDTVPDADSDSDSVLADAPLNAGDILHSPSKKIGGETRFKGGSTCSVALVSTPTPVPFWHPSTPSSLIVAHVGDTRILLCRTSDGRAAPVTSEHHPSNPSEGRRLTRYANNFVTDSFGEQRISGLANTRAFGDMQSKRIGVSAEPEIRRVELAPAEYSFMVLVSDGVSGTLTDQEIVDVVKEARTPDQGARDVVALATEVVKDADNATCVCVRLGGWERRSEGGLGSLGTRESRDYRKREAAAQPMGRTD